MGRRGSLLWSGIFFIPLIAMVLMDGFCTGRELCHAGLSFTLLLYAIGIAAFLIALLVARVLFRKLKVRPEARIRTLKLLIVIPLIPAVTIIVLLFASLLGRL